MNNGREQASININVPDSPTDPPRVDKETLTVRQGQEVAWHSNRPVRVVFPDQSPFVRGNSRNPVNEFNVRSAETLRVRDDAPELLGPPGHKYTVVDINDRGRPELDPYIIIEP